MLRQQGWRRNAPMLLLAASLLLTVTSLTACTPRTQAGPYKASFRESFEAGLIGWETGADVPEDGERPGPVDWSIEVSDAQASDGQLSARFFLDGKHDDGTIWLVRSFNVPGDMELTVTMSFDAWSESESFNTMGKVAAYAGPRRPNQEGDFDLSQALNQAAGWRQYGYSFVLRTGADRQLWVALGITAVWETQLTYYFDNLVLKIEAR
jgi:hypothetical protein